MAAWLGARLLAGVGAAPVTREASGPLTQLSHETGLMLAETVTGHRVAVQGRRGVSVSIYADSAFGHAVHELVAHHVHPGCGDDRLVLALGRDAKGPARTDLRDYLEAIRHADAGADLVWLPLRTASRRVGAVFLGHAERSWREITGAAPTTEQLRRFAERLTVLVRDVDPDGRHAIEARCILRQLVRDPGQVDAAWDALVEALARLGEQRAACDRRTLQRRLIGAGVELETPPDFRRDVARLARVTTAARATLERRGLTIPSPTGPVALSRSVTDVVEDRLTQGATLITGEAGVGKTVVLAHLLDRVARAGVPVLALSAVTTPANSPTQLMRQLGIGEDLQACLMQWDPQRPGVLAVDALHEADEAQTKTWCSVMATASQAGWGVVAADRLSHLRHAPGLRSLFPARAGPGAGGGLPELADTHHVHVGGLTDAELAELTSAAPQFGALLDDPSSGLVEVLRTPFNLRLAGELLQTDIDERSLRGIRGRLDLLQQYSTWVATVA